MNLQDPGFWMSLIQTLASISIIFYVIHKMLLWLHILKPIRLEVEFVKGKEGIINEISENRNLSHYINKKSFIPSNSFIKIDIITIHVDKPIRVSPYIYIKRVNISPIKKTDNQISFRPEFGMGGGGYYKHFSVELNQYMDEVSIANFQKSSDDSDNIQHYDFFLIGSDEKETFVLLLDLEPEFIYTFKFGIEYYFRGNVYKKWSKKYSVGKSEIIARQWKFVTQKGDPTIEEFIPCNESVSEWLLGK